MTRRFGMACRMRPERREEHLALFGYYEYVGDAPDGTQWQELDEVWHLD